MSVFFHSVPKQTDQGMTLKHPGWKNGEVEMAVTLGNSMSLQATGTINSLHLPFSDGRPSIHALISAAIASRGETARSLVLELPEADNLGGGVRFVAGALDALLGRRDKSPRQTAARTVVAALTKALRQPSANTLAGLYQKLRGSRATAIVDELIERLRQELAQNRDPLAALARRLVR